VHVWCMYVCMYVRMYVCMHVEWVPSQPKQQIWKQNVFPSLSLLHFSARN